MHKTIQEAFKGLLACITPVLTTGAYGDEGSLAFALFEDAYKEVLAISNDNPMSRRAIMLSFWSWNQNLEEVPDSARIEILDFLQNTLQKWTPLRFRMSADEVNSIKTQVFLAIRRQNSYEPDPQLQILESELFHVLDERSYIRIERGGETWHLLFKMQILHTLGSFIVEVETSACN